MLARGGGACLLDIRRLISAARAGQGLGAAMLSPAALSIIMAAFTQGNERAHALGAWGAVGGAGAAVGVLLGGTLTELVDWRLIFLTNLPVGVVLAVGALKIVPVDAGPPRWRGLDLRGALLATLSLGPPSQALLHELLIERKRAGAAVLLTTHQMAFGDGLADRAVRLEEGVVADEGSWADVRERAEARGWASP